MPDDAWLDPHTLAVHADRELADGPGIAPPIHAATSYDRSRQEEFVYRRSEHPTTDRLEAVLGALEGGHAVVLPSGMSAAMLVLRHFRPRRVALPEDLYHGVRALVAEEAAAGAVEIAAADALEDGDLIWIETPSNPRLRVTEIAAISHEAKQRGVTTVVDSTFATPILQKPLALGADVVIH